MGDIERIDATGDMLDAALCFFNQRTPEGRQLPPLLLKNADLPDKKGSSAAAAYKYHAEIFNRALGAVISDWQNMVASTEGNADQAAMLTAFLAKPEWGDKVRAVYDATSPLRDILCDDSKAPALIAQRHLALLDDFRGQAESYLGIAKGQSHAY